MGGYALIAENIISEIKYRTDIEQLIGGYVQLKKRGTTLVGLCPFHSEKTPSFTVWPQKSSYYCFGCAAGGDAITFIRQIENLEYPEALEFLAKRVGVEIPKNLSGRDDSGQKLRVMELNRFAARWFHERLFAPEGAVGLAYLKRRRFSDKTIKRFGLGYAPSGWDDFKKAANAAGFSDQELVSAFLASAKNERTFDMFRNRVMFPIIDSAGGVIAFGGRILDDSLPKYINSSDTAVFKKSRNLFALNFAKKAKAGHLILAEGYMDVIMLHQAGFFQAVATLGTALTQEQARLMARYTDTVIVAYDSDKAGTAATQRAYEILRDAGLSARVLEMKDAKDPDEYIKKFGKERFAALLEGSADALSFKLRAIRAKYDLNLPEEKTACLKETASELANIMSEVETDVYAAKAAGDLSVDKSALLSEIRRLRRSRAKRRQKEELRRSGIPASALRPEKNGKFDAVCAGIIRYLFDNPADCERVCALLPDRKLPDPFWDTVLDYVKLRAPEGEIDISPLGEQFSVMQMGKLSKMLSDPSPCLDMNEVGRYIDRIKLDRVFDIGDRQQLIEHLSELSKSKRS